jgi:hypothetical protein
MAKIRSTSARFMTSGLSAMVTRGEILAVYPLLTIAAFWWGDQSLLFATSVVFPALLALQAALPPRHFLLPEISGRVDRSASTACPFGSPRPCHRQPSANWQDQRLSDGRN